MDRKIALNSTDANVNSAKTMLRQMPEADSEVEFGGGWLDAEH